MKTFTLLFALLTLSASAVAGPHSRHYNQNNGYTDYARVVDVEPVYEWRKDRYRDRYTHRDDRYDYDRRSSASPVLGAIIGGGIGNAVGNNKSSKRVGAIAGAVLGAAIASDLQKKRHSGSRYDYRDDDYCEPPRRDRRYRVITGYDVTYRYHGQTYHTHMKHKPGRKIKVVVDVRPAY